MALAATTDAVAARANAGGAVLPLTGDVMRQPGRDARSRSPLSTRLLELPTAAVSLPSRSGSNPDLLDAAGHTPAAFVRVPSGLHAGVFRPGSTPGTPRRTAIPLFVQSC